MNEFWDSLKSGKFANMVKETARGEMLNNSKELYHTLKPLMAEHDDVEVMYGIFMDAKNRILSIEKITTGSICSAVVFPRELVKACITRKAAALVMAHNHPSGDTVPSPEDRAVTLRVLIALKVIGVTLHEHMIVGDGYFSMADNGLIAQFNRKYTEVFQ